MTDNTGDKKDGRHRRPAAPPHRGAAGEPNNPDPGAGDSCTRTYSTRGQSVADAGIRAGEIIGYRAWIYDPATKLLHSMWIRECVWAPQAVTRADDGTLEWWGLHSFKTQDQSIKTYHLYANETQTVIFGSIAMWGNVIEHERGYRAECAKVVSLDQAKGDWHWMDWRSYTAPQHLKHLKDARERYGV